MRHFFGQMYHFKSQSNESLKVVDIGFELRTHLYYSLAIIILFNFLKCRKIKPADDTDVSISKYCRFVLDIIPSRFIRSFKLSTLKLLHFLTKSV